MVGPRFGPDFPWTKGLALACITLSESVCSTVLYPFVPFMVRDFGVPDNDVGFYAGLLASAYNIAQIPAGIFWGKMSDIFGRRPVLFVGLIGQSLGMLGLGLSWSLTSAIAMRCFGGLAHGNNGVLRALLKEIMRKEQQSSAFSLFGAAWGIGFFIGPLLGGELSRLADRVPALQGTVIERQPYLLPCLVATCNSLIWIGCLPRLRPPAPRLRAADARSDAPPVSPHVEGDTSPAHEPQPQPTPQPTPSTPESLVSPPAAGELARREQEQKQEQEREQEREQVEIELEEQRQREMGGGGSGGGSCSGGDGSCSCGGGGGGGDGVGEAPLELLRTHHAAHRWRGTGIGTGVRGRFRWLCDLLASDVMRTIYAQFGLHFTVLGMAELFPLFAADESNGLGFAPAMVGDSMLPLGLSLMLSPCVFPPLEQRFGPLFCFRLGVCLFVVLNFCFPLLRLAREAGSPTVLMICTGAINFCRGLGGPMCFGSISVILNNQLKHNLGLMNGLASSFASLARALSPWVTGAIYASSTGARFPFDSAHASFYTLTLMACLTLTLTVGLRVGHKEPRPPPGAS